MLTTTLMPRLWVRPLSIRALSICVSKHKRTPCRGLGYRVEKLHEPLAYRVTVGYYTTTRVAAHYHGIT